jgi:hypothetical protein
MSAVLKIEPVAAKVVHKPTYNNRALANFNVWYANNEAALGEYFLALPTDHPDTGEDFRDFVLCQYDVECELQAAARRTTYGDADEGRAWDAETQMADFRR